MAKTNTYVCDSCDDRVETPPGGYPDGWKTLTVRIRVGGAPATDDRGAGGIVGSYCYLCPDCTVPKDAERFFDEACQNADKAILDTERSRQRATR